MSIGPTVSAQASHGGKPRATVSTVEICRYCHQWMPASEDRYCSFCGRTLMALEVEPELVPLISKIAMQRSITLRNTSAQPMHVAVVQTPGETFPAVAFDPSTVDVAAGGEAKIRVSVDEKKLPPAFLERTVDYACIVNEDPLKQRPLKVTVRSGPLPRLQAALDFGYIEAGETAECRLELQNAGGTPLRVTAVRPESQFLSVKGGFTEQTIAPMGRLTLPILWDSRIRGSAGAGSTSAGIRIDFGNYSESAFVPARARIFRNSLELKPAALRYHRALMKRDYAEQIHLENNGTTDLEIDSIDSDQDWISVISRAAKFTLLCASDEKRPLLSPTTFDRHYDFNVVCRPKGLAAGRHSGSVTIRLHGQQPVVLPVEINVVHPKPYGDYIGIDFGTTNSVVAVMNETTHTIELVAEESSQSHLIPSVLVFDDPETYKIGVAAKNEAGAAPDRSVRSIKRIMGYDNDRRFFDRDYSAGELASRIIRKLVQLAEQKLLDDTDHYYDVRKAIITVPANFFDLQIREVLEACRQADLDPEEGRAEKAAAQAIKTIGEAVNAGVILDEPSAAVLYYIDHLRRNRGSSEITNAIASERGLNLLVFDYGGGTLDVSVATAKRMANGATGLRVLANMGDNRIGGDTIDLILMKELLRRCKKAVTEIDFDTTLIEKSYKDLQTRRDREGWSNELWRDVLAARTAWKDVAEEFKIRLSAGEYTDVGILPNLIVRIADGRIRTASKQYRIDAPKRETVASLLQPILAKCRELVEAALMLAPLPGDQVDYILHTGRQSLLPAIRECVREMFPGLTPDRDLLEEEHLKICVAKGAALYGWMRGRPIPDNERVHFLSTGRRLPHSYGVETFRNYEPHFDPIVPRGSEYPTEATKVYGPEMIPDSGYLTLKFYQNTGTGTNIVRNPQITLIGQISIDTAQDEKPGCEVRFVIGPNRTLEVFADGYVVKIEAARLPDEEGWMA